MSGPTKRELIKQVYPSKTWAIRVNAMSDAQVTAIYLRMKGQGKL